MTRLHFLAPLFLLTAVVGCSFQDATPSGAVRNGDANPVMATFSATRTTLVPRPGAAGTGNADLDAFGLPRRALFQFRTCLVDRATSLPVRGVSVIVSGAAQPQTVTANGVGCIDWSETVEYRRLAPEHLLAWPRTLDVGGGRLRLDLALDPWARASEALVDYSGEAKPTGLVEGAAVDQALRGTGDFTPTRALEKETTNLYATQLAVRSREDGVAARGSRVAYHLTFQLGAGRRAIDGSWVQERITAGKFKGTFALWEQPAGAAAEALSKPVTIESTTVRDGVLDVRAVAEFERAHADGAKLYVKYNVEPDEAGTLLMASEGWMQLRSVVTTETAVPSMVAPDRVREGEVRPGPVGPAAAVGYQVKSLQVAKVGMGVARDWAIPVAIKATVCLVTADERQPINATSTRQFSFQISADAVPGRDWVGADEYRDNCFAVRKSDAVAYEVAQRERYVPLYLHIRGEESRYRGVLQTRRFALNPWQADRPESFFADLPEGIEPPAIKGPDGDGVSQLTLQDAGYQFSVVNVRVNEFLQRTGLRKYRLTLRPKLASPWRFHSGHDEIEPVFEGMQFRVHGIFSTPKNKDTAPTAADYLGDFVTDFQVGKKGEATRNVLLPVDFPEMHRLRSVVTLTLRLTPIPTNSPRRPHAQVLRFSFDPLSEGANPPAKPVDKWLAEDIDYTQFVNLIPTGGAPVVGNFDGFENRIPRSPAVQRWEQDGVVAFGLQPKFRDTPVDLFARYWKDAMGVRPVHLTADRREAGWAHWPSGAVNFPDAEKAPVAMPEINRDELLRDVLDGPVSRGASIVLPDAVLTGLCAYYAAGEANCKTEPGRYFDAITTLIAGKVTMPDTTLSPLDAEGQLTGKITVQASFFKEVGYQERAQRGDKSAWTANASLQSKMGKENLGTGGGFVGGVGYGVEEYHSTEIGVVDGLRNRRAQATSYELQTRKFPVALRVDGDACLLVRPFVNVQGAGTRRPALLYCAGVTNVDRSETWYELLDGASGPPTVVGDPTNPAERGWLRTVRGDAALTRLRQRLMDDTSGAVFHKVGPWIERFTANVTRSPKAMVEGTAMDEFSAAGAEALVARDGGLFPGVFELNAAVASYQENWSEKAFGEKMHAVYQGVVSAGLERNQIPFVVQKNDEGKDIRVPDLVTEAKRGETFRYLRQARAYSRCLVAEYARKCTLGLYETDRPLCLAKNRKAVRATIEAEMEAERKRINGACAALAKGAFP